MDLTIYACYKEATFLKGFKHICDTEHFFQERSYCFLKESICLERYFKKLKVRNIHAASGILSQNT